MVIHDILRREKYVYLPEKHFKVNYKRQGSIENVRRESQQTWINKVVLPTPLAPRTATFHLSISTSTRRGGKETVTVSQLSPALNPIPKEEDFYS